MLFTCKNFMFFDFTRVKKFCSGNGGIRGGGEELALPPPSPPPPSTDPFLYGPEKQFNLIEVYLVHRIIFLIGSQGKKVSGQLPLEENGSPVRVGVWIKVRISFMVGEEGESNQTIAPNQGLGQFWGWGTIFRGGNCPRTGKNY